MRQERDGKHREVQCRPAGEPHHVSVQLQDANKCWRCELIEEERSWATVTSDLERPVQGKVLEEPLSNPVGHEDPLRNEADGPSERVGDRQAWDRDDRSEFIQAKASGSNNRAGWQGRDKQYQCD
jgi:hypothetical protein